MYHIKHRTMEELREKAREIRIFVQTVSCAERSEINSSYIEQRIFEELSSLQQSTVTGWEYVKHLYYEDTGTPKTIDEQPDKFLDWLQGRYKLTAVKEGGLGEHWNNEDDDYWNSYLETPEPSEVKREVEELKNQVIKANYRINQEIKSREHLRLQLAKVIEERDRLLSTPTKEQD